MCKGSAAAPKDRPLDRNTQSGIRIRNSQFKIRNSGSMIVRDANEFGSRVELLVRFV